VFQAPPGDGAIEPCNKTDDRGRGDVLDLAVDKHAQEKYRGYPPPLFCIEPGLKRIERVESGPGFQCLRFAQPMHLGYLIGGRSGKGRERKGRDDP